MSDLKIIRKKIALETCPESYRITSYVLEALLSMESYLSLPVSPIELLRIYLYFTYCLSSTHIQSTKKKTETAHPDIEFSPPTHRPP